MSQEKKYINGAFLDKVQGYEMVNMDFRDEFIENLKALPKNERGYRRVTIASRKSDPNKWSIYENEFVPKTQAAAPAAPQNNSHLDDLPF